MGDQVSPGAGQELDSISEVVNGGDTGKRHVDTSSALWWANFDHPAKI